MRQVVQRRQAALLNRAQAGQQFRTVVEQHHARRQQKGVVHPKRGLVAIRQGVVQRAAELRLALAVSQQLVAGVIAAADVFEAGVFKGKGMSCLANVQRVEVPSGFMKRAGADQVCAVSCDEVELVVPAGKPGAVGKQLAVHRFAVD